MNHPDPLLDFTDKVALITGAASGLGRELALALAKRGAKLVLSDIDHKGLHQTVSMLPNSQVCHVVGDVADEKHAIDLVARAVHNFATLDIAVNNAGIAPAVLKPLTEIDADIINRQLDVNAKGVIFGMKHQLGQMQKQSAGVILNVSSVAGIGAAPNFASYAAAKHAVVGVTRSAAVEFGAQNIRVNAICPFFTLTPMVNNPTLNPHNSLSELNRSLATRCPMQRIAHSAEVVAAMLMILSPANSYMNGAAIPVDGGFSAI